VSKIDSRVALRILDERTVLVTALDSTRVVETSCWRRCQSHLATAPPGTASKAGPREFGQTVLRSRSPRRAICEIAEMAKRSKAAER
jgi:hypothetical protein